MLTPAQPVPPAAAVIRVNCAPQLLLHRGKDTADSSWAAEKGTKRKTVSAMSGSSLRSPADLRPQLFNDRELRDFVGDRHVGGDARCLFTAGIHTHVLDVVCLVASVAEVFDHFVSVIERLSTTHETAVRAVETILQRWRQFLIAPSGPRGRDQLA